MGGFGRGQALAPSGVETMEGRFQPTESGFILEGEVREAPLADKAACSVTGAELDAQWQAAERSLFDALKQYEGRKVRITVEVVDRHPVDTLREVLERFRLEAEAPDEASPASPVW
jgi:hypothetical protein